MRKTMLIGLALVVAGAMALYQVRNGPFLSLVGQAIYSMPKDTEQLQAAFAKLAETPSATPGVTLAMVAEARLTCALSRIRENPNGSARAAFTRMNLMLLGVGVDTFAPVIDPEAYRLTELRRGLTHDALPWRGQTLNRGEERSLDKIFTELLRIDHPAYADLKLANGFSHYDFTVLTNAMLRGEAEFHDCVAENRA